MRRRSHHVLGHCRIEERLERDGWRRREGIAPLALRFTILTAARTGEVRGMLWQEVDSAIWTVPRARMKTGKVHEVPLSTAALDVLRELLPGRTTGSDLVFPGGRHGRPLSDMAISEVVRRMNEGRDASEPPRWRDIEGQPVVPHGFRASFKAWSLTHGYPDILSEMALAHADKDKVRAAYLRPDMLDCGARARMMQSWAEHCSRAGLEHFRFKLKQRHSLSSPR